MHSIWPETGYFHSTAGPFSDAFENPSLIHAAAGNVQTIDKPGAAWEMTTGSLHPACHPAVNLTLTARHPDVVYVCQGWPASARISDTF